LRDGASLAINEIEGAGRGWSYALRYNVRLYGLAYIRVRLREGCAGAAPPPAPGRKRGRGGDDFAANKAAVSALRWFDVASRIPASSRYADWQPAVLSPRL